MPQHLIVPYGLIIFGIVYLVKPDLFYALLEMRKASVERKVMPPQNKAFMRALGVIFVVAGVVILVRSGPS
jgi:hypothetical protein